VTALLVAVGGALGAVSRYWMSAAIQGAAPPGHFAWGTFAVNVSGCLAMGVASGLLDRGGYMTTEARAFLAVGVLGGFTTFSAFANETAQAMRAGATVVALLYAAASVLSCLAAVWVGRAAVGLWAR
jgi:CrcB protein